MKPTDFQALIFDMDGTIVNTVPTVLDCLKKALAETERELEAKQNWLDDLLDDDAPLTFEKIELADDLKDE